MLATASYLCLCWHLVFLLATALLFILTSNSLNLPTATALLWEAGQENVIIKKDETTYFQHFVQTHLPESIQFKPRYYNTKACWIDPIVHPPHGMTRLLLDFGRGPANCGRAVGKISERMETNDDRGDLESSKKWPRCKVWDSMITGPKIVDWQESKLLGVIKITDDKGPNRETQRS